MCAFPPHFPVAKKRSKMKPHFSSKAHLGYLGGRGAEEDTGEQACSPRGCLWGERRNVFRAESAKLESLGINLQLRGGEETLFLARSEEWRI